MREQFFKDLVICGPDMSGTSTQVNDFISYFRAKGLKVRDIRGSEIDLLFHAKIFKEHNKDFVSFNEFFTSSKVKLKDKQNVLFKIYFLLSGSGEKTDLMVGSFKKTKHTTFIDPNSADVWVLEEPAKRGAGQVSRVIDQNRSSFDFEECEFPLRDGLVESLSHQAYRNDEFFRIRKILRDHNKIIIRSRCEESACYQVYDKKHNPHGIKLNDYLSLHGHKVAFKYPPTHIFVVCGPQKWNPTAYLDLKSKRSGGRVFDDYEIDVDYQLLVNKRYASNWLEKLYEKGSKNSSFYLPHIYRFDIYDSKESVKKKMFDVLDQIITI